MKSIGIDGRKKYLSTVMAIAEGLWNGFVVSGVLTVSAFLINKFWIF